MSRTNQALRRRLVGLDIGGSKTDAMLWAGDAPVARARAGSANVQGVSIELAERNLAEVFAALDSGPIDRVVAGSGGMDTEADAAALRALIAAHAPGADIVIVHDTRLILAAAGVDTGVAVILGTGSAVWGINPEGREARAGGWGYVLGDEASGYWMAREAVRHTLRAHDRGQAPGDLARRVLAANNAASPVDLIALFHENPDRHHWAGQSPLVFEALAGGDPAAAAIVSDAVAHVRSMAADVTGMLGFGGPVVIGGGLGMHQRAYRTRLRASLAGIGLHDVRFLQQDPVEGAKYLSDARGGGAGAG
ncbi:BadF/BadG/BcrA/BcrD ATPase family protein [Paeniglutamicibacter cryotolerans]|nr:BadF/BadG/BcrA/BcrD ATPase family protein [Paeniglutamicibacter cryotolerans]